MNDTEAGQDVSNTLLATAALILTTLITGYAVTQSPRGFGVWLTTLFICWTEALVGTLMFWRQVRAAALSGATSAILFTTTATYAAAGFASVVAFLVMRNPDGGQDRIILGILLIETVVFFFALRVLVQQDQTARIAECETVQAHGVHVDQGMRISDVIAVLSHNSGTAPGEQRRMDVLSKRLYALRTALIHSHAEVLTSSADADISNLSDALNACAARVRSGSSNLDVLPEMESLTGNLENILRRNRIS